MQHAAPQLGILAPLFRWAALLTRPREVSRSRPKMPPLRGYSAVPLGQRTPLPPLRQSRLRRHGAKAPGPSLGTRRQAKAREAERMLERQRTQAAYKVHINMSALKSGVRDLSLTPLPRRCGGLR